MQHNEEFKEKEKKHSGEMPLRTVPLLPHILLMLITGMRRSDGLKLTWDNIDLETSNISFKTLKTQKVCVLPLIAENNRVVSPKMHEILNLWKNLSDRDTFVLPHPKSLAPVDVKQPLEKFRAQINIPELKFQNLRKTFISYAVSSGIPPAVTAMWTGKPACFLDFDQGNRVQELFDQLMML